MWQCKQALEKFEVIQLHALGNAASTAVIAAENLVRNDYAEFFKVHTLTISPDEDKDPKNQKKKAKLEIHLKKSPHFQENIQKFN